jgi:O-acetyl-ADP-ribose deacetylase (regulator of RNase III)
MDETRQKYSDGCPTGAAVITGAGNLPAKWVIHAVGPIWNGGDHNEPRLLASAYESCLSLAADYGAASIAFPSLSTGAYGYPVNKAAKVAVKAVIDFLKANPLTSLSEVRFVLYEDSALHAYEAAADSAG